MRIRYIAEMVAIDVDAVSERGKQQARRAFVDTIGVCFPGLREPMYQIMLSYAATMAEGPVSVPLLKNRLHHRDAALMWGALAHAIDFDDSCPALCGHPSVVLLPVVLACGAAYGCTGKQALDAYICGYEACNRMAVNAAKPQYATGWHTTTSVGIFGGVVAACRLIGCTVEQTEHALGIAASLASGIQSNFGSMTKPLHPGFAAQNAIAAAELALRGITASPKAFLDDGLSYFACYGGSVKEVSHSRRFIEEGITTKPYPSCGCTTRANYLAIRAYREGIRPEDIDHIDCKICQVDENCLSYHRPANGTEAKFSLEYGMAKSIQNGIVRLADFSDEAVQSSMNDPAFLGLVEKIRYTIPEDLKDRPFYEAYLEEHFYLKDGRDFSWRVEDPLGFPGNPMSDEEIRIKFMDCLSTVKANDAAALYEKLIHIDQQSDMAELINRICALSE